MPSINPLVDLDLYNPIWGGNPGNKDGGEPRTPSWHLSAGHHSLADTQGFMSPDNSNQTNAAGTAENTAMHVALLVAVAGIGVYVLRQTGFRFVVAAGVGS